MRERKREIIEREEKRWNEREIETGREKEIQREK